MSPQTLPINEILVEDRQRRDLGDLDTLAESLKQYGLIQPIVVNSEKRLIAGGRRLAAAIKNGWTSVSVVFRETLSVDELHELELEENVRRKDLSWQERCLCVAKIHALKKRRAALNGEAWGHRETGEMLGQSHVNVGYALYLAKALEDRASKFWQCDSMADAWRLVQRDEEDKALAELARRHAEASREGLAIAQEGGYKASEGLASWQGSAGLGSPAEAKRIAFDQYLSNPLNPPDKFEEYWLSKQRGDKKNTIYLSTRLFNCDAIEFMNDVDNEGRFDHIVTDPPYAIDMEMLEQDNTGMLNIDTIAKEHNVEYNYDLLSQFFPAAYKCTKENAFVITWCDAMLFRELHGIAVRHGFRVQRWPFHWVKPHGMNQAAQYNQTKATEIAMLCRKPNAVRALTTGLNYEACPHDDLSNLHPFAKPFRLWERLISEVSITGQTILEPFAGRGSAVISMLRMERNFVACESNVAHYNALLENVKQYYLSINPSFIFE